MKTKLVREEMSDVKLKACTQPAAHKCETSFSDLHQQTNKQSDKDFHEQAYTKTHEQTRLQIDVFSEAADGGNSSDVIDADTPEPSDDKLFHSKLRPTQAKWLATGETLGSFICKVRAWFSA